MWEVTRAHLHRGKYPSLPYGRVEATITTEPLKGSLHVHHHMLVFMLWHSSINGPPHGYGHK